MKVNYHCHSRYCRHAQGSVEDYVRESSENGIEILGCSDHAPFPEGFHGNGMDLEELDSYLSDVENAKKKYSSKIKVYKSLEIEFLPHFHKDAGYYSWLLTEKKLDYLLLGEHFFIDIDGNFQNIYCPKNPEIVVEYAKACVEAMETGLFKILAHPDIFGMVHYGWNELCDKASDMILEGAYKNNTILEYNANGRRRGIQKYPEGERFMYPCERFWEKVKGSSLKVVVGSDCHDPKQVWDKAMDDSIEYLAKIGIKPLDNIF